MPEFGHTMARSPPSRSAALITLPSGISRGVWPTAVMVIATGCYAATASSVIGLGDAPEALLGVRSAGVLHPPGYVAYVAAAHGFAWAVPIGDLAESLNLFSAACALAATACLYVVCRRCGALRPAAAMASLGFATAASVWFYAGYAKHDAFTALVLSGLLALLSSERTAAGHRGALLAVGLLAGLSLGAGWYAVASAAPGLVLWLRPNPNWQRLGYAGIGVIIAAVCLGAATMALASNDPAANWGNATSPGEVVALWSMQDVAGGLHLPGAGPEPAQELSAAATSPERPWLGARLANYLAIAARDLGPGLAAMALVAVYAIATAGRRRPRWVLAVAVMIGANLVAVSVLLGVNIWGFRAGIAHGGFLIPTLVGTSVLGAVGLTHLATITTRRFALPWTAGTTAAAVGLAAIVIPGAITHREPARQLTEPIAERYAETVLGELPADAVLIAWQADRTFALTDFQDATGARPDVAVIAADGLTTDWYRDQVQTRHQLEMPRAQGAEATTTALVDAASASRPVYLDAAAQRRLARSVAFEPVGLTARVLTDASPGTHLPDQRADTISLINDVAGRIEAAQIPDTPARTRWPNQDIISSWAHPLKLIAQVAINDEDWALALTALDQAAVVEPDNRIVAETRQWLQAKTR